MKRFTLVLFLGASLCTGALASEFKPISLAPIANHNLQNEQSVTFVSPVTGLTQTTSYGAMANSFLYPSGDQDFDIGGETVPFRFGSPGGTNWAWSGHFAAQAQSGVREVASATLNLTPVLTNRVFTAMNTWWGWNQAAARLTFKFKSGSEWDAVFVGGVHVRDYNKSQWSNTLATNSTGPVIPHNVWNNVLGLAAQNIDIQEIILPSIFWSDPLLSITFTDLGDVERSRAYLFGLTILAIPEPATWMMVGVPLLALAWRARRRRRDAA